MEHHIIADSCCDLTPQLKAQLDVTTIPLTMRLGETEYPDDETLNLPAFMREMDACTGRVGSAAPPPGAYQEAFTQAGSAFAVTLSSQLSGSYASAVAGKACAEENGADVHVFDSKSASAGETLITLKLGEMIRQKLGKEAIIQCAQQFIDGMKTYFVLEKYDNLQKNGRLGKIAVKFISILGIRLVMGADGEGNIALFHKARGENQMLDKLLSLVETSGKKTQGEEMVISHCNNPGLAGRLAAQVKERFGFATVHILPTGGLSSLYADDKGLAMAF